MINWITDKIARYFRNKAIAQINDDPSVVAREHFGKVIPALQTRFGEIQSLFWVGAYQYNTELIEYFKAISHVSLESITKNDSKKSTEDENIIDLFIGKNSAGQWLIAFFADELDLNKGLVMLDSFNIKVKDENEVSSKIFTRII